MSKIILNKKDQMAINKMAADVVDLIRELSDILKETFNAYYSGKCGSYINNVLEHLFDEWLYKNMNPKMIEVDKIIELQYSLTRTDLESNLRNILEDFDNYEAIIYEILASKNKGIKYSTIRKDILYELFNDKINIFIDQTSIQFVGRYLMLFVGIDKKAWSPITPVQNISNIYLNFYWIMRTQMYKIIPSIYNLNELDWMYVEDKDKQLLSQTEIKELDKYELFLNTYLGRMYKTLNKYDFSKVDSDIWKDVYQKLLPKEEENRLGFVHTPDEMVDAILDLIEYKEEKIDLCKLKILDPACGSGTFLINALSRLLSHLESDLSCHSDLKEKLEWKTKENKLDVIKENLVGIDINPFATFLTTMNLVFILMDDYSIVRQKNPYYRLDFNIITNDSLAQAYDKPILDNYSDPREAEAMKTLSRFTRAMKTKYDLVIGNPPWGTVLRGKLGPLGNEEKRTEYKNRFKSATGKYDIYVLFMERGINLLEKDGKLGFITQVNYVSQDYGDGIKQIIKTNGSIDIFVDLQTLGGYIFPGWTNYPAITIFTKGKKQQDVKVFEVEMK